MPDYSRLVAESLSGLYGLDSNHTEDVMQKDRTAETMQWQRPLTPWRIVQLRFFAEKGLDPVPFSAKHGLDERVVREILGEAQVTFFPEFCVALAAETGMSAGFFENLSEQYRTNMA